MATNPSFLESFMGSKENISDVAEESSTSDDVQCQKIAKILYQHSQDEQFQR